MNAPAKDIKPIKDILHNKVIFFAVITPEEHNAFLTEYIDTMKVTVEKIRQFSIMNMQNQERYFIHTAINHGIEELNADITGANSLVINKNTKTEMI